MFGDDGDHTWPEWGEFDIMEWIHEEDEVSTTLHTKAGCAQKHLEPGKDMKASWNPGMWGGTDANDCWVHATGQWANQGCSQRGLTKTIGPSFNEGWGLKSGARVAARSSQVANNGLAYLFLA